MHNLNKLLSFLNDLGYDNKYVEDYVFPDWFCEQYFEECSQDSIIMALSYCARRLGLDFGELSNQYYQYLEN